MNKILICGLSGAGKTYMADRLVPIIEAVHFNADEVRKNINKDLKFSKEDRIEQATRMGWLCDQVVKAGYNAVADFICPTKETREAFGASITIWMDTIPSSKCKFSDTAAMFEPPTTYDIRVTDRNIEFWIPKIVNRLHDGKTYSLFIGRYQPLHQGHKKLIQVAIDEGKNVLIALRNTELNINNPYSIAARKQQIAEMFGDKVKVISIPDVSEVCYGRRVGYKVREIKLGSDTENISSTKIREQIFGEDYQI